MLYGLGITITRRGNIDALYNARAITPIYIIGVTRCYAQTEKDMIHNMTDKQTAQISQQFRNNRISSIPSTSNNI